MKFAAGCTPCNSPRSNLKSTAILRYIRRYRLVKRKPFFLCIKQAGVESDVKAAYAVGTEHFYDKRRIFSVPTYSVILATRYF